MQKLSKTQVLALLLGAATAQIQPKDLINGPTSTENTPTGTKLMPASSGSECNLSGGCDTEGEKCGAFQKAGETEHVNLCVAEGMCGVLGKIEGTPFSVQCWDSVSEGETPVAPDTVDAETYLAELKSVITKVDYKGWDDAKNLLVSQKFNYQDGWYIQQEDGQWIETDKPLDNRCYIDDQCDANECCSTYPDQNNRRCMLRSQSAIPVTMGPVTFTPTCGAPSVSAVPTNAQDDIAKEALSEASEELDKWFNLVTADTKKSVDYENLSEDLQKAFDAEQLVIQEERSSLWNELKAGINYHDDTQCDDSCKAIFEAKLLKWEKNVYEQCNENNKQITCARAKELQMEMEKARAEMNYYTSSEEQREAFDNSYKESLEKAEASLVALEVTKQQDGKACKPGNLCGEGYCCGSSMPTNSDSGRTHFENICIKNGGFDTIAWEDAIGESFTHICYEGAMKIATSVATAVVVLSFI